VLGRPPGEALAALEDDLLDEMRVGLGGSLEHEPLVFFDEVDEARVHRGRVREQAHDRAEDLLEVQGRANRRDDRGEKPAFAGVGARRAYAAHGRTKLSWRCKELGEGAP
jgi:hypothetical protein